MSVRSRKTFGVAAALALSIGGPYAALAGSGDQGCIKYMTTLIPARSEDEPPQMEIVSRRASEDDIRDFGNGNPNPNLRVLPDGSTVTVLVTCDDTQSPSSQQIDALKRPQTCNPDLSKIGGALNCH